MPHSLVIKDVNTGYTAIIPIHDHFRLIDNQDSDSTSIFSGASKSTQRFLLITMGVFLGLVLLGIIGELVYKTMWKANKRVENSEG